MFKFSFKQQILTGFAITLIFVFISALVSYLSIRSLSESYVWIDHTNEVVRTADQIEIEMINAETGLRDYVITHKDDYRSPYNSSIDKILPMINDLRKLVSDNTKQTKLADSMSYYAALKIENMKQVMRKALAGDFEDAKAQILTDKGRVYKTQFLRVSKMFIGHEMKLLKQRKNTNTKLSEQTIIVLLLSSIIIFGLVVFLLRYIRKTFDQQKETERLILKTNEELAQISALNEHNNWLLKGVGQINESMRGEQQIAQLANNIVSSICKYVDANVGSMYLADEERQHFYLAGSFSLIRSTKINIQFGDGLIGQVAIDQEPRIIDHLPLDYLKVTSSLGETAIQHLFMMPILFEGTTMGVIEVGFLQKPAESKINLLNAVSENIGIAINSALEHLQLQKLFEQTQQQAEELTSQQEELRTTNEELLHKSEELQASEEELRVQQEELQRVNAELQEKAQQLVERNASINQAKEAISLKAEELELSSKYKSEFLANMSHELRTPLNSILILARILKENRTSNLTDDQIKYAGVIHNSGSDLLSLINDILDLSKIESGNIDLIVEDIKPISVKENIESLFTEMAKQKNIDFKFNLSNELPGVIATDQARLQQIVKNLLSNAFKFTPEKGSVTVEMGIATDSQIKFNQALKSAAEKPVFISVTDTGIGIAEDKQQIIFEAFKQEDGSTSRKYGGTGLGLSISKELSTLLGGEINLVSEFGVGSTFTVIIPQRLAKGITEEVVVEPAPTVQNEAAPKLQPLITIDKNNGKKLLIVEDDVNFAEVLSTYAKEKGFEPIVAHAGDKGLEMAISEKPSAIVLDIMLPVMDGWTVLKKLKANPSTQHIPIHMMSAGDEKVDKAKREGAIGFLKKPVETEKLEEAFQSFEAQFQYSFNNVLVIEDQILQSNSLTEQLIAKGAQVSQAYTGSEARQMLKEETFDCIILDLKLPDVSGFDLLDEIKQNPDLKSVPVIINTAMELDKDQMSHIMQYTQAMVLKSNKSNDRLLDEVSLFMNKLQTNPQATTTKTTTPIVDKTTIEKTLKDKVILVADDDMRNIFALSSALEDYEIKVVIASNGLEALKKLEENDNIDLVLMDIMMPEMDGYEAMRKIREQRKFKDLPVIALTAKAMKNDREKCIEAGASDYISKPVDIDKLLSMLRVWLS